MLRIAKRHQRLELYGYKELKIEAGGDAYSLKIYPSGAFCLVSINQVKHSFYWITQKSSRRKRIFARTKKKAVRCIGRALGGCRWASTVQILR